MISLNHSHILALRWRAGCFHALLLLPVLIAGLGLTPAGRVTAQTFITLHSFTANGVAGTFGTNGDGAGPEGGLVSSGNSLYGTARFGGSGGGTLFKVSIDGMDFTTVHSFPAETGPHFTNSDGGGPRCSLILTGNTLYGTARSGGYSGWGTVFRVNTDGTGFTNLHNFTLPTSALYTNSDGGDPNGGLVLSGNTLYGAATFGGSSGNGTVFALNTDGTAFTNLHTFAPGSGSFPNNTNSEGAYPYGRLLLSGNTLYGTTAYGGSSGDGTVFALNTDGTCFTKLHNFTGGTDGTGPQAGLILSGNVLYGTTLNGGSLGAGSVFKVSTSGTGFTNLYNFTGGSDGGYPYAGLILSGHTLYGTASADGTDNGGTVFALNTDGTGFTKLHNFTSGSDGANPYAGLTLSGNTLYGTAAQGSGSGNGTIFSISLPAPQLTAIRAGGNVILTWPTDNPGFDYTGYTLEFTTNLGSSAIWTTNSPAPVVINGQNTVTNPISGTQQFFRLSQ